MKGNADMEIYSKSEHATPLQVAVSNGQVPLIELLAYKGINY